MAQQNIFLGTAPNDGTGTKPRPAGQVINENFTEVYAAQAAQSTRLNGVETFTAAGSGAVSRPLSSVLNDTVDVRNYGADPTGNADSTAAFLAAFATNKPVVAVGQFRITASIAFRANRQWLIGHGCQLNPVGNFDLFTIGGALEGCGIVGVNIEANQMTGGRILFADSVGRFSLRDMVVWSPFNFAWLQRFNYVSYEGVWVNNIRGTYGTTAYGDNTTGRSDILRISGATHSGSANNKPHGLIVNGAVNTIQLHQFAMVNVNRGLWVTNSANAGLLPQFVTADDLAVDFSVGESVRLEVGAHYYFVNPYFHGSSSGSGVYVAASVAGDSVIITGGKITSHARYGVENLSRVRVISPFMAGNALGDFSDTHGAVARSPRFEVDPTGYFSANAGNPALNFDADDYVVFNRASNAFGVTIGGTSRLTVDAAKANYAVPVQFPGYSLAFLPSASANSGNTVRVTDRANRLATSDGTVWRFMDGTDVATGTSSPGGGTGTVEFVPAEYRATVDTVAGNYTIAGTDNNRVKVINGPAGNTTSDVVVSLTSQPVGTTIRFIQGSTNKLSFEGATGASQAVNAFGALKRSNGQFANVVATVVVANTWVLSGQLAA